MPLSGSNKREYQKEYMRKKRQGLTGGSNIDDKEYAHKMMLIYRELKGKGKFYSPRDGKEHEYIESVRIGIDGPTFKDVEESIKL